MKKIIIPLCIILTIIGIYSLLSVPSVDPSFNKFFKSEKVEATEIYTKEGRRLVLTIIDGDNIKESDAIKFMAMEFASQVYTKHYSQFKYSEVSVVFKSINKDILLKGESEYEVDELRYDFRSEVLDQ